ncbi:MAG: YtfJ family protein [Syntrophobacteraceae bacterium]|nr:YtfJ family protein [Syntrophobacteraceae bacterium]
MKCVTGIATCMLAVFLIAPACLALEPGQAPPRVELKGKLGGRLNEKPWSSSELKGKVSVVFYVDPDVKDLNNPASEALKKAHFPRAKYQSYGIINMASTWMPNFSISAALSQKQKSYPDTIYIRDYKRVLVTTWKIADNSSDVLAFDKNGKLIFEKNGKLSEAEVAKLVKAVSDNL